MLTLSLETKPAPAEEQVVLKGLRAFNVAVIGDPHERPIAVFARDDEGQVLGGLLGHIKWRWLYVAKLWLPDSLRGSGTGTKLMRIAEEHAWKEDCLGVHLDTFEYQASPSTRSSAMSCSAPTRDIRPGTDSST